VRRALALVALAAAIAVAVAAVAAGKTTKNFTFTSHNKAVQPGAVLGTGAPGTFEDFPFTIAAGDRDGTVSVGLRWANPADDFDLYVYEKHGSDLEQVASSAQGGTTDEQAVIQASALGPIDPGQYVIRVQNYASTNPAFDGVTKFSAFRPQNKRPKARLKAPKRTRAGRKVKLDASRSKDPDGKIVRYLFDLNGDGSMEVDNGSKPTLRRRFEAGHRHVGVRVVDNKGKRAYATRTITVLPRR
jgi:hypothetical protein